MVISVGPVVDDERRRMRGGKCLRRVLEFAVESVILAGLLSEVEGNQEIE
jgi:hypothetical protein